MYIYPNPYSRPTCPGCGRCNHCGRPYPWTYPATPWSTSGYWNNHVAPSVGKTITYSM